MPIAPLKNGHESPNPAKNASYPSRRKYDHPFASNAAAFASPKMSHHFATVEWTFLFTGAIGGGKKYDELEPISWRSTATWGRQRSIVAIRPRVSGCDWVNQSRFMSK